MKRFLVLCIGLLALITPFRANALTPYTIHWINSHDAGSCGDPTLTINGDGYFHVNQTPIPTFEVPGSYTNHQDGSRSIIAEAPFDSVLLHWGANDFFFG
ncbi:MAG: hypothetical protein HUU21_34525, partial [Polyangiaceae bacterium]|nr:hypothetical protein [Polyangiaceae bacterium]